VVRKTGSARRAWPLATRQVRPLCQSPATPRRAGALSVIHGPGGAGCHCSVFLPSASSANHHESAQARESKLNPHHDDDQAHRAGHGVEAKAALVGAATHTGSQQQYDSHEQYRHSDGDQRHQRRVVVAVGHGQGDDAGNRTGTGGQDDQWGQRPLDMRAAIAGSSADSSEPAP